MIKTGTKIHNHDGSGGYEVTQDIKKGDVLRASLFRAFGSAAPAVPGMPLPHWLGYSLDLYAKKEEK